MVEVVRSSTDRTLHPRCSTDSVVLWYYDNTARSGGYFLLNSTEASLIRGAKEALERAGISCRKEGACFRPANNGRQYKTFIRLLDQKGCCPDSQLVKKAIRSLADFHFDANPAEVRKYFNRLHEQIEQLEMEVKELRAASEAQSQVAPEESSVLEKLYESDISALRAEHSRAEAARECLSKQCRRLEEELANSHAKLARREESIEGVEVSRILDCLLPNIELVDHSLAYILTEVKDYRHILKYLYKLNGGEPLSFKSFRSAKGWLEVNKQISNGQSNKTRMYYRHHPVTKKIQVLVSDKDEQENDERRLQRLP